MFFDIIPCENREDLVVMELVFIALIGLFAGIVKGTSGFGSSLVAFPLLLHFYPESNVVVMLITFNVFLNTALLFEHNDIDIKALKHIPVLTFFGVVASLVGLSLLGTIDEQIIRYIAFVLIVFAIVNTLFHFRIPLKDNSFTQAIIGTMSGLGNGIASIDGPPVVFYLVQIKADKKTFRRTLATYFLFLGLVNVIGLLVMDKYTIDIIMDTLFILVFAIIGVVVGMLISKRLNEERFKKVIVIVLIALAIRMIM